MNYALKDIPVFGRPERAPKPVKYKRSPRLAELQKAVRLRNRVWVYSYLLTHPCVDCGEVDPVVLDFDHVRGIKRRGVSQMLSGTSSLLAIAQEIEKCDVRCANCHRRVTAKRAGHGKDVAQRIEQQKRVSGEVPRGAHNA